MSKTTSNPVPERALAQAWRHLALGPELVTASGQKVQVIFPGRRSKEAGPDFRDAILAAEGGELFTGDVEVDVRSSSWRAHGHADNPSYRQVVLQVVLRHDAGAASRPEAVPVLPVPLPVGRWPAAPVECPALARSRSGDLTRMIEWAGDRRFHIKGERFFQGLERAAPGQLLYEGLLESLGYSRNQKPFRRLAARLPIGQLNRLVPGHRPFSLQALLFGSAGLLPGQTVAPGSGQAIAGRRPEAGGQPAPGLPGESVTNQTRVQRLEREWLAWHRRPVLRRADWCFFPVRPANTPSRRLAAAAYLLAEQWLPDPAARLLPLLEQPPELERSLATPAGPYWKDHLDFGVPAPPCPSLLGPDRRRDMIVNIVLPFFYAWGSLRGWQTLRARVQELYVSYPAGADNALVHFMQQKLPGIGPANRARRQQGLLHLYHNYCRDHRCRRCPLLVGSRQSPVASQVI